jgi:hypothetical protein
MFCSSNDRSKNRVKYNATNNNLLYFPTFPLPLRLRISHLMPSSSFRVRRNRKRPKTKSIKKKKKNGWYLLLNRLLEYEGTRPEQLDVLPGVDFEFTNGSDGAAAGVG